MDAKGLFNAGIKIFLLIFKYMQNKNIYFLAINVLYKKEQEKLFTLVAL